MRVGSLKLLQKGLRGTREFVRVNVVERVWTMWQIGSMAVAVTVLDVMLVSFYRLSSGHLVVEKYPHLTNSAQGAALVLAGDLLSQSFVRWMDGAREMRLDWSRLAKAGVVGVVNVGLWPYYWYKIVDTYLPNQVPSDLPFASLPVWVYEWALLALKIVLDGFINGVFSIVSSFTLWSLMDQDSYELWKLKFTETFFETWMMDWKSWPIYNVLCFTVIPLRLRPMTSGVASMIWNAYVSHQSQSVGYN